jgi:hypothetical protein
MSHEPLTLDDLPPDKRDLLLRYRQLSEGKQRALKLAMELTLEANAGEKGNAWVLDQLEATGDSDCREIADLLRRQGWDRQRSAE